MDELLSRLLLFERFEYSGSSEDLKSFLMKIENPKYDIKWLPNNEFVIYSKFSFGTAISIEWPDLVDGIKGYGVIRSLEENKRTEVSLSTKLRIELYFILATFVLIFATAIFIEENLSLLGYLLLPIFLITFWTLYRIQEKELFNKLKRDLENFAEK